jgi:uncharacterized glyoxalase superfamily protein PhnB
MDEKNEIQLLETAIRKTTQERDELRAALHNSRIALTFYREHMERTTRTRYPFGIEAEEAARALDSGAVSIPAAPAMLEALVTAESALFYAHTDGTDDPHTASQVKAALQTVRETLREAFPDYPHPAPL